jgi:hypothetical protein
MDAIDPRLKAGAAWGGVGVSKVLNAIGIGSWGDFAAMCAALYSLLLIGEWLWKKWKARGEPK